MSSKKKCSIMGDCNLRDICLALLKIKDNNFLTETILLSPWGNSLLGLTQRAERSWRWGKSWCLARVAASSPI